MPVDVDRMLRPEAIVDSSHRTAAAARRHLVPERDFRGPGCTDACEVVQAIVPGRFGRSDLLLHDPTTHEEYGRATSGPTGSSLVWTGPLVVDRWRRTAVLGGRHLHLTHREWEILDYLAGHLDRRCPNPEVTDAIWGPVPWDGGHVLRVGVTRLRAKLAPHEQLIETNPGLGYRLKAEPPIEALMPDADPPAKPWAQHFPRCVCCGTTERQHYGHGRCSRCRMERLKRWPHYGPCAAPPPEEES